MCLIVARCSAAVFVLSLSLSKRQRKHVGSNKLVIDVMNCSKTKEDLHNPQRSGTITCKNLMIDGTFCCGRCAVLGIGIGEKLCIC